MNRSLDERLSAYLDGELAERERNALESGLADQPQTAQQLETLRALERALGELPRLELREGFAARFRARLELELAPRREPWWQRWSLAGAGALAATAAGVALAVWLGRPHELGSELEQVAEIRDPETWELLRSEEFELLEVLEILEAWDGVQES